MRKLLTFLALSALIVLFVSCPNPTSTDPLSEELTTSQLVASLKIDYSVPGETFTAKAISAGSPGFTAETIRTNFTDMAALITTAVGDDLAAESLAFETLHTIAPKTVTMTFGGTDYPFALGESKVKMTKEGTTYTVYWSSTFTMPNLSATPTRLLVKFLRSGSELTVWMRYPDLSTPLELKAYCNSATNAYKCYQSAYDDIQNPGESGFQKWMTLGMSGSIVTINYKMYPQTTTRADWLVWGDSTNAMIARADDSTPSYSYLVNNFWFTGTLPAFFDAAPEGPFIGDGGWTATESDRASFLAQNGTVLAATNETKTELGL